MCAAIEKRGGGMLDRSEFNGPDPEATRSGDSIGLTAAFLRHILPTEGWKCVVVFRPGRNDPSHKWFKDFDVMAAYIHAEDQRGRTVYHACGAFKEKGSRKQENSIGACCLILDIEGRPGKAYQTVEEAYSDLVRFCSETKCPLPFCVASGAGLHVYWVAGELLPPETWLRLAEGLKTLCERHGLQADHSRTTDLASILRPPGTSNRKYDPPREVLAGNFTGPYALEALSCFLVDALVLPFRRRRGLTEAACGGIKAPPDMAQGYPEGQRDVECTRRAGWLLAQGKTPEEAVSLLLQWNDLNTPPLPEDAVRKCVDSIARKEAKKNKQVEDAIEALNQKHFVIGNIGGKCLIGEWIPSPIDPEGQALSFQGPDAFKLRYANQYVGGRALGLSWLQDGRRKGYEGIDLVPNGPEVLPNGYLNLWRGFGVEPKKGDWSLMEKHIREILANDDPKAAAYILRSLAWDFQNPGKPAEVALATKGPKGSGKGVLGKALRKIFGEHGLHIFSQKHLTGNFNAHLRSCLFLFADEAFWAGDKKGEGVLKGLITEPTLMIEQKGVDAIMSPNRLKIMMAANAEWVVPASRDERRYAVFEVSDARVGDREYFKALHHELGNGGLEAMLFDLRNSRKDLHEALIRLAGGVVVAGLVLYFRTDIANYIGETPTSLLIWTLGILFCGWPTMDVIVGWLRLRDWERRERDQEAEDKRRRAEREREEQEQQAEWDAFANWVEQNPVTAERLMRIVDREQINDPEHRAWNAERREAEGPNALTDLPRLFEWLKAHRDLKKFGLDSGLPLWEK